LLHDIGEIYINGNILNKKEKLTGEEYQIIKNHVVYGANLVKQILNDRKKEIIVKIIMEHHERYDGSGYPRGLKGEEIDLKSRIISVADAVDSMITGRNYKARMSTDEVINELKANKGTQFDPTIADVMIKILYERTVVKSMVEKIPIIIATLSVFTKDNCFLIPGTLIKKEAFYEFHHNYISDLDLVKWPEVSQLTLSYVANQDIFEYQAKLLEVKDSIVYLSNLENKSTMISYSLLWELRGVLYIDETTAIPIKTARISGDVVSFFITRERENFIKMNKLYKICLYFAKNDSENITGMISQQYNTGYDCLNYFTFYNTPDAVKDRIFRRIFRKQVDLKYCFLNDLS
jgi:transcriptional regulator with XRE-family HTH domain